MVQEDSDDAIIASFVAEGVLDQGLLVGGRAGEGVVAHRDSNAALDDDVVVVEDKPFSSLLRRKRAKGKLSATAVMELADTAARQGCQDLGSLDNADVRSASRRATREDRWLAPLLPPLPVRDRQLDQQVQGGHQGQQ